MAFGIHRDSLIAVFLLLVCGVFLAASFEIEETNYGTMQASLWPQVILAVLALFSLLLLGQSLRHRPVPREGAGGLLSWLLGYRNPLLCYALFLAFLLTLPILGMLVGGSLFVFGMLSLLGPPGLGRVPFHAAVALGSVGFMWAVFTFALGVFLPAGLIGWP